MSFIDHVRPIAVGVAARVALGAAPRIDSGDDAADRLDLKALRRALAQLVHAVQAIHRADKLHCDLKPSNVLVTARGQVVVLDFGLTVDASSVDASSGRHRAGTPAYMAPDAEVGPASDWYAIGVMLFEALTGRLPFEGDSRSIMMAKRSQPHPSRSVTKYRARS